LEEIGAGKEKLISGDALQAELDALLS
jgi:hypothetical protein